MPQDCRKEEALQSTSASYWYESSGSTTFWAIIAEIAAWTEEQWAEATS